jgi:hypothetical protein
MIVIGEAARAAGRRIDVPIQNGTRVAGKTDWIDTGRDETLSPNVFLVDLPPASVLDTHFHRENQFQVFVKGEGSIGAHRVAPVTVHYAGAYTGYGPLVAGSQGVSYLTIRPVYDTGAFYMPGARGDMVRGPKRSLDAKARRALPAPEFVDLIALQPDRIAAQLVRLPPRTPYEAPDPAGSGGQFIVVAGGSLAHAARASLLPLDIVFVSADEPPQRLHAQEEGAEVLLLQLAMKAPAYARHGWSQAQKDGTAL